MILKEKQRKDTLNCFQTDSKQVYKRHKSSSNALTFWDYVPRETVSFSDAIIAGYAQLGLHEVFQKLKSEGTSLNYVVNASVPTALR